MTEVIIGLDPHKASNTISVRGRDETIKTRRRFDNTDEGLVEMLDAVAEFDDRVWAVEGANGIGRSVAQRLVATFSRVPPPSVIFAAAAAARGPNRTPPW